MEINPKKRKVEPSESVGDLLNSIKYFSLTEKTVRISSLGQYTFVVDRKLQKSQIKAILEKIYDITVIKVNTMILAHKKRRVGKFIGNRSQYKKAYVHLKAGDTISIY